MGLQVGLTRVRVMEIQIEKQMDNDIGPGISGFTCWLLAVKAGMEKKVETTSIV